MRPFLRGFADELIKIADFGSWSDMPRPPSTARGTEQAPRVTNALPPSAAALNSIPKQRMDWSTGPKEENWRPSPGFRLDQPKPAAPTPKAKPTGGKSKPIDNVPAFETFQDTLARKKREGGYNAGLSKGIDAAPAASPAVVANSAKGEFTEMSPERRAFFAAQPQAPKNNLIRKPGGLRSGGGTGGVGVQKDPNAALNKIDAERAKQQKEQQDLYASTHMHGKL